MTLTAGTGLAKNSFSFPKIARKVASVDVTKSIIWSDFDDSVLIKVNRAPTHPLGNTVCTGVLIHERMVITSAHCADGAETMTVVFDVQNGESAKEIEIVLKDKIKMHPDYDRAKSLFSNDLSVLILEKKAPVQKRIIRRIPLDNQLHGNDQMIRIGVGLRNNKNMRNITDPRFVKLKEPGVLETSDTYALFGDSGGPIYTPQHELIGIHSTMDSFDGKAPPHAYSAYLPFFKTWIDEQLRLVK